jgi:hypothetical protein
MMGSGYRYPMLAIFAEHQFATYARFQLKALFDILLNIFCQKLIVILAKQEAFDAAILLGRKRHLAQHC